STCRYAQGHRWIVQRVSMPEWQFPDGGHNPGKGGSQCSGIYTHFLTFSLSHILTVSLSHSLTVSLSHSLTVSLSHSLTLSLSHSLTLSLSRCLTLSPGAHPGDEDYRPGEIIAGAQGVVGRRDTEKGGAQWSGICILGLEHDGRTYYLQIGHDRWIGVKPVILPKSKIFFGYRIEDARNFLVTCFQIVHIGIF